MVIVLAFSISVHESSHAKIADKYGDPTGKLQGRISINPLDHVDPIGTILVPAVMMMSGFPPFGWARPVPVNPSNLKKPARDRALVSAAGPVSNFLLASVSILLVVIFAPLLNDQALPAGEALGKLLIYNTLINTLLGTFNLIPVPPLDGGGILVYFLPRNWSRWVQSNQDVLSMIFLVMIVMGVLGPILRPVLAIVRGIQFGLVNLVWGPGVSPGL